MPVRAMAHPRNVWPDRRAGQLAIAPLAARFAVQIDENRLKWMFPNRTSNNVRCPDATPPASPFFGKA